MENPAEVKEIRNKLRMMKFPQDEIVNTVRRQQRAIYKQKQANETIRKEIDEYEKEIANIDHQIEQFKTNEELQRLNSLMKNYTNKLSVINADLAAEEQKRRKLEDEVSRANSKHGGFYKQSRENQELQARLRTMENRLDKALLRYNGNLQKLAKQRSTIDELRKNRFIFKDVMRQAEREREESDNKMAALISTSNQAYSERDRMKMDLVTLKQAEKEDIKNFDEEYQRLNQQIEGQRITQNRPRDQQQAVPSINSQLGSQSDQQEELTAQTDHLQEIITQTLHLCGFNSHEELIEAADQIERENFSLYNFVVEHGSTRARLQDEIDLLELQHTKLLQQVETSDEQQKSELEELTVEIKNADDDLTEVKELEEKNKSEFEAVYQEIQTLFETLGCSWDHAPDESQKVQNVNAMFCLGAIENSMAEMMGNVAEKVKYMYSMRGITDYSTILTSEQQELASQKALHTKSTEIKEAPKLPEMSKPLTIEEMMQMLNQ
ncbi:hypothetical protein TRFO_37717 [Tritrichomonas foetus]|uniref:ODAD1 central coiled coil region domain-containing protein n=1 Tax=Tritrichomonas foetus TaxID=1144522 RepID=A0A1J4JAC5_9EUKA|nr:hypothetical protein TRFO_37717 [Tritrichomonas foetus]|eukprot:OHS96134.1 hypothetical protein TRFO_37717 [Tritrichomonas foetus]